MNREITIKAMVEDAQVTREVGMIKYTTISTVRTSNDTSAVKRDIHITISQIKKDKDNDEKSTKTTSIRSSVKNLGNYVKKIYRAFTTSNTQLQRLKESDSDVIES